MKKMTRSSLALFCAILLAGCANVFNIADLRLSEENTFSNQEKAQRLMNEMGVAHGIASWDSVETYTVVFEDEFYGFIGKQAHPFKEQKMSFSLNYIPGTFNGQLKITSGKEKGEIWGIHDWQTYFQNDQNTIAPKKNKDMKFWIPTYQYFIEFPSRIQEATSIDYIGEKIIDGIQTEGIIASWNTTEPQKDIDQYLIWIDANSKRIVKIEYTVRDAYKFVSGAATFRDYKSFNGILFPSEMPVESNLTKDNLLHTMCISNFTANVVSVESLTPLKEE